MVGVHRDKKKLPSKNRYRLLCSAKKNIDPGICKNTPAANTLEKESGFNYRTVLGELMCTDVTCRLDIGYVLTKLSQFSNAPAAIHYKCLKKVAIYLRTTKYWGILYWRPKPFTSLPTGSIQPIIDSDTTLPPFPSSSDPLQLVGYFEASHATDIKTRRSVTGFILTLCGGAICYRSKVQTSVATSSTESEFVAAVTASKAVLYLCSILRELGFEQCTPTPKMPPSLPFDPDISIQHFAI